MLSIETFSLSQSQIESIATMGDLDGLPARVPENFSALLSMSRQSIERSGAVLLRAFPVNSQMVVNENTLWNFSSLIGHPIPQDANGKRIDLVRDDKKATVRGSKTNRHLGLHTDFATSRPDVFGLLVLRQAPYGGQSRLVDCRPVVAYLNTVNPELLSLLETPRFFVDREGDQRPNERPYIRTAVISREAGHLSVLYNRARIHRGHRKFGDPLTSTELAALDALEAAIEAVQPVDDTTVRLESSDLLFVNNHYMLHGREAFDSGSLPGRTEDRELLRVWLRD